MEQHRLAIITGLFIVFGSHIYILYMPDKPLSTMQQHCYINILAAILITYYFIFTEKI